MSQCTCELCQLREEIDAAKPDVSQKHYALLLKLYQRLSHEKAERAIVDTRIAAADQMLARRSSSVQREAEMWRIMKETKP